MSVQTPDISDVAGYAAAVRRALVGLGPEQVEDLTDGLEANLAEALADESTAGRGADPVSRFGTPEEYAAELGAAAGLGPVEGGRRRRRIPDDLRHPVRALRWFGSTLLEWLRGHPWWRPVEGFLVSLRPAWWVLRGWVVWQLTKPFVAWDDDGWMPRGFAGFVALGVLVVASVQWGRGRWRLPGRWQRVPVLVSIVAAAAVVPVMVTAHARSIEYVYQSTPMVYATAEPQDGVWVDGMQVSNLFVYDADGNPLSDVQIYDDRGRPVDATGDEGQGQWYLPGVDVPWSFVGVTDSDGRTHWNVYPRQGAPVDQFGWDDQTGRPVLLDGVSPQDPPRPFVKAPALVGPATTPDGRTAPTSPAAVLPGGVATSPTVEGTTAATDGATPAPTDAAGSASTDATTAPPAP